MKFSTRARISFAMAAVRHPFVARLFAMVESFQWRVALLGERVAERAKWRHVRARSEQSQRVQNAATAKALADRLAGSFVPLKGYPESRLWLRKLIFRVMVPGWVTEALAWRWYALLGRWHRHPGRYEACTSQLIAEWLDTHTEYARRDAGDTETTGWVALFAREALPFPWPSEALLFTIDSTGFRDYAPTDMEAGNRFLDNVEEAYENDDEPYEDEMSLAHRIREEQTVEDRERYHTGPGWPEDGSGFEPTYGPSFLDADEVQRANDLTVEQAEERLTYDHDRVDDDASFFAALAVLDQRTADGDR